MMRVFGGFMGLLCRGLRGYLEDFGMGKGVWEFSIVEVKSNACKTSYTSSNAELLPFVIHAGFENYDQINPSRSAL